MRDDNSYGSSAQSLIAGALILSLSWSQWSANRVVARCQKAHGFCPTCGHLLITSEERRVVTVLFADLVGFTSLSEGRDPEHIKHLIDRCFERLVADISTFGGSVDKIVGDAVIALFGAPTAHEDDSERAVRAGLRMQRTIAEFTADLDVEIRMRIGISTGEVLVGAISAGGDYTAMGDTVNTASRLETMGRAR